MDIPCLESNKKEATIHGLQPATAYLFEISVTTNVTNAHESLSITKKCKTRPPKLTGTTATLDVLSFSNFLILFYCSPQKCLTISIYKKYFKFALSLIIKLF